MARKVAIPRQPFSDDQGDQESFVVTDPNTTNEAEGVDVYHVEHLLAEKWSAEHNDMLYLVKWENYPEEE
jgi:hypothetical protein